MSIKFYIRHFVFYDKPFWATDNRSCNIPILTEYGRYYASSDQNEIHQMTFKTEPPKPNFIQICSENCIWYIQLHKYEMAFVVYKEGIKIWHRDVKLTKPDQEFSLHQGSSSDLWVHTWIVHSLFKHVMYCSVSVRVAQVEFQLMENAMMEGLVVSLRSPTHTI